MASACVNNIGASPENFLDCPSSCPSYGWLSPRISFSSDAVDDGKSAGQGSLLTETKVKKTDLDAKDLIDFEFRLDDPVAMLPADELFSGGKLVPLHYAPIRLSAHAAADPLAEIRSARATDVVVATPRRLTVEMVAAEQYVFSPKAPRCSSRWRELLGFKKVQSPKPELQKSASEPMKNFKSLKCLLHRSAKSASADSSLCLPLLRDSELDPFSISSRISLSSSSSSGPDHDDISRPSLDSEKPISSSKNPPKVRISKTRTSEDAPARVGRSQMRRTAARSGSAVRAGRSPMRRASESTIIPARGVSVDSPRMNSSGKIVFQSLERSSSSPGSFNAGCRNVKTRGMERSYSANVRITPVLNVPVCTLRGSAKGGSVFGFGQLFSPQRRDSNGAGGSGIRPVHTRCRTDRI